jgi:DtxR family Mn-dependent transcriptional regulator
MEAEQVTVSSKAEEYLETIYRLEKKTGSAKTMELARQLKVVPGSITNTIESLERRGLVTHKPYRGVKLTERGKKLALNVLRRHRLAERLLTDILHLEWSEAHDAACKLEHAITPNIIKPLEKTLGHPKTCPHGSPIPTACGGIFEEESVPLVNLNPKESGIVVKIIEEKVEVLQYLTTLGLTLGDRVKVEKNPFVGGPVSIKVGEVTHTLDHSVASIINVRRTNAKNGRKK